MKKILFFIFIMSSSSYLYSQNLNGLYLSTGQDGPSPSIWFENNNISLLFPINGGTYIEKEKYLINSINGIYKITILSNPGIVLYLLFDNEFGYFSITTPYKYDSGILLRITDEIIQKLPRGGGDSFIRAFLEEKSINGSSFLKENGIEYKFTNIMKLFTTYPWVEGKEDTGIGEYIELDYSQKYIERVDTIIISNGFFSPNNPNLYYQNNRVKKILIEEINGIYKQEFDVRDSPNIQSFKLGRYCSKIRITITDVYYGTEYNDTCINYLSGVRVFYRTP